MAYTELTVWTRGIIMDKEGRDIVNSISASARIEGKYAQAMENYVDNPDRTNCPTRKYCRVSDDVLAPGWTDYRERVEYQAYDVTANIVSGANVLAALLAPGWYSTPLKWFQQPNS